MTHRLLTCLLLFCLSACAASNENGSAPVQKDEPTNAAALISAAVSAEPEPIGIVDYSCRSDADCAVKNVGNCCGYYPACVNKDSETFPEQVKEQCTREGRMAICGFREISECICTQGRCDAAPERIAAPVTE